MCDIDLFQLALGLMRRALMPNQRNWDISCTRRYLPWLCFPSFRPAQKPTNAVE